MVLLELCCKHQGIHRSRLAVAHFNHNLRSSAAKDQEFVFTAASKLRLDFYTSNAENPAKTNIEAWARRERYHFLEQTRREINYDYILTAHHADDQSETLLMKLIANRDLSLIDEEDSQRSLLRPLIDSTRQEIEEYQKTFQLDFIEDQSNSEVRFLRNKIRMELIPYLEKNYEKNIKKILTEQSLKINSDYKIIKQLVEEQLELLAKDPFGSKVWLSNFNKNFKNSPRSLKLRLVEASLLPVIGYKIGYQKAMLVLSVLENETLACELPNSYRVFRKSGSVMIEKMI